MLKCKENIYKVNLSGDPIKQFVLWPFSPYPESENNSLQNILASTTYATFPNSITKRVKLFGMPHLNRNTKQRIGTPKQN